MSSSAWLLVVTVLVIVGLGVCLHWLFQGLVWAIATLVLAVQEEVHLKQLDRIADVLDKREAA
jgi:hypothetical protein